MERNLAVVILAAGQGTRMNSVLPKVVHPIGGRPMLSHVIASAQRLSPQQIHVVYGHGGERVKHSLGNAQVQWCLQAEQLGTGHALMQALPEVEPQATVLVLYGDVPLIRGETLQLLLSHCEHYAISLLSVELEDPTGYGRIIREGHVVHKIIEEKDASEAQRAISEVNTGILAAKAKDLDRWLGQITNDNAQGEYYLTDCIAQAVTEGGSVNAMVCTDAREVMGINDKCQLAACERTFQQRQAERLMRVGVTLLDPARVDVRGEVSVGSDVSVDINVIFEGKVALGDGASIGPNCILRDTVIGPGTRILANTVIEEATIGQRCEIGPFTRIRPATRLADEVRLGNFVEVKKSVIEDGSKVNHLSYIGDSEVGRRVNVGAGTITCNYDGANKHTTRIGDDVFIGSDTQLIAPVTVGDGATIGAGSTITKDAPENRLTLSRARQLSIEGWRRPRKSK